MNRSSHSRSAKNHAKPPAGRPGGFTLVEMLVATAVLIIILGVTLKTVSFTNDLWMNTRKRIDTFQEARAGFESMTRKMSQAMLNTYWDYADSNGNARTSANATTFTPTQYLRQSELHFVCGQVVTGSSAAIVDTTVSTTGTSQMVGQGIFFQAPLGYATSTSSVLPNLLNASGYFLEFSDDNSDRPNFLQSGTSPGSYPLALKYRYRLKELSLPSENLGVYTYTRDANPSTINYWIGRPLTGLDGNTAGALSFSPKSTLAQNVIALVMLPKRSPNYPAPTNAPVELAPKYLYDSRAWTVPTSSTDTYASTSRNQLPPQVQVTMIAIDEASAARLAAQSGTAMPTFSDSGYNGTDAMTLQNGLYTNTGACNLFQVASTTAGSGKFDQFNTDLTNLLTALVHKRITYRIFQTDVTILQSKFSDN